jgi:hypothetical protein
MHRRCWQLKLTRGRYELKSAEKKHRQSYADHLLSMKGIEMSLLLLSALVVAMIP